MTSSKISSSIPLSSQVSIAFSATLIYERYKFIILWFGVGVGVFWFGGVTGFGVFLVYLHFLAG